MNTNTALQPGNVAIVTGGSRGLGRALVGQLLARGLRIVTDGRDAARLEDARREFAVAGEVVAIAGDVTDKAHVQELFAAARRFGQLELLVNNASTLGEVPLPNVDHLGQETLERLYDVNVFAPVHLMQHALRAIRRGGAKGTIVNITSDAGAEAYPGWGGYGATKAALEHLSRVLAAELEGSAIRVLVADPGDMDTQMHRDAIPDADPSDLMNPADSARALLDAIAEMQSPYERIRLKLRAPA